MYLYKCVIYTFYLCLNTHTRIYEHIIQVGIIPSNFKIQRYCKLINNHGL